MKIKEILKVLDKTDKNSVIPKWENFGSFLFIDSYDYDWEKWERHLKGFYFAKWLCTDTYVGGVIYFLDDEFVAASWQGGRKRIECIEFLSIDHSKKVRNFMFSCMELEEEKVSLLNSDYNFGDGYKINYSSQCLKKDCTITPRKTKVKIIKEYSGMSNIDKWDYAVVRYEDGKEEEVRMSDLLFDFGS